MLIAWSASVHARQEPNESAERPHLLSLVGIQWDERTITTGPRPAATAYESQQLAPPLDPNPRSRAGTLG